MFKQIPIRMTKLIGPEQKVQKLMIEIGGGWYMEKITKGVVSLSITKLSKEHKKSRMKF